MVKTRFGPLFDHCLTIRMGSGAWAQAGGPGPGGPGAQAGGLGTKGIAIPMVTCISETRTRDFDHCFATKETRTREI